MTETTKKIDFQAAMREGIARFKGEWVEPVEPAVEEVSAHDYPALNRVFDKFAEALKDFSGGSAMIGHRIDPKVNGYIDVAAARGVAGKFTLLIKHAIDDNLQIEVGSLETSADGFPANLSFQRQNYYDPNEIECRYDEELEAALGLMASELRFGTALRTILDHENRNKASVTLQ
jgi:hypothetical protein